MSELKIRCSSLGKIMTNPRTKKETLSKTCKTYIQDIFKENEYGIVREFRSRYIDKGIDCETQSIELAPRFWNGRYHLTRYMENNMRLRMII